MGLCFQYLRKSFLATSVKRHSACSKMVFLGLLCRDFCAIIIKTKRFLQKPLPQQNSCEAFFSEKHMKVKVYSKINLTLNVCGKSGAFHLIDSLAVSAGIFDEVEVTARNDCESTVSGCGEVPLLSNSAYKAATAFSREFSVCGADVAVKKGIPMGAGLGGSSADAAAVVYCMCKLYGKDESSLRVKKLCERLGSDVNFMLGGGFCRMRGKGDDLEKLFLPKPMFFVITVLGECAETANIYSAFDSLTQTDSADNDLVEAMLSKGDFACAFPLFNNGLKKAFLKTSRAADVFVAYAEKLRLNFNMTGSGSAFYVPLETLGEAEALAERLRSDGFNSVATCYSPVGIEEI